MPPCRLPSNGILNLYSFNSPLNSGSSLVVVVHHARCDYRSAAGIVVVAGTAAGTAQMAAGPGSLELERTSCRIQEVVEAVPWQSHPVQVEVVASLAVAAGTGHSHSGPLAIVAGYSLDRKSVV